MIRRSERGILIRTNLVLDFLGDLPNLIFDGFGPISVAGMIKLNRMTDFAVVVMAQMAMRPDADMTAAQSVQVLRLEKTGLLVTDSLPQNLSAELISQYLEIKARHLL